MVFAWLIANLDVIRTQTILGQSIATVYIHVVFIYIVGLVHDISTGLSVGF